MKNKIFMLFLVFVLAVIMTACGTNKETNSDPSKESTSTNSTELMFTHKLGETAVKKNPKNIVVFDFGILDSLDKLGVDVVGVPMVNVPPYLSKYKGNQYENVGGLKEPDFEKISELNPELIIISTRQIDAYEEFAEIAPTLYVELDYTKYIESFSANMNTLGEIFDKQEEVTKELAMITDQLNTVKENVSATGANGLIIMANSGNISAYGPSSRFGFVHDEIGLAPVDATIEVSQHGQNITFEYIMAKDPDYLLVVDRDAVVGGDASAKQTIENDLVKNTKAYKNGHIIYLDPNYWYLASGGLVSVSEMIKAIDNAVK